MTGLDATQVEIPEELPKLYLSTTLGRHAAQWVEQACANPRTSSLIPGSSGSSRLHVKVSTVSSSCSAFAVVFNLTSVVIVSL